MQRYYFFFLASFSPGARSHSVLTNTWILSNAGTSCVPFLLAVNQNTNTTRVLYYTDRSEFFLLFFSFFLHPLRPTSETSCSALQAKWDTFTMFFSTLSRATAPPARIASRPTGQLQSSKHVVPPLQQQLSYRCAIHSISTSVLRHPPHKRTAIRCNCAISC